MQTEPWLVLIDLQRDFYHPSGAYGQAGRPLEPIQEMIRRLTPLVADYPRVLRVKSCYHPGQWPAMPDLCVDPEAGGRWHPELEFGPSLIKTKQSGADSIRSHFQNQPRPLVLAGVCTHRCVRATLEELQAADWPTKVLAGGVAACGRRQPEHQEWLTRWKRRNLITRLEHSVDLPSQKGAKL